LLAARLSHHIRNSLVAVKTFLDLAPSKLTAEDVQLNSLRDQYFWKVYYRNYRTQIEKINNMPKDFLLALATPSFEFNVVVRLHSPMEYGINLMACFFIVHHHGGMIVAQRHETKGTSFILRLPVDPNQRPIVEENQVFLEKVLLNDTMWEKLMAYD